MADVPVRKIAPGVSGGEGIKGIKRFGQDREDFENQRDADTAKLGDVEQSYRKIGAFKKGGPVKGKETKSKPLPAAGSDPGLSSMIGGMSNAASSKSDKKAGAKMAFARGGSVGIAPYKEGGFRNKAMEHKR